AANVASEELSHQRLGRYFSPEVRDAISARGSTRENREITVIFADLRGFTAISEAMSADQVAALLDEYFSAMVEIIFRNGGTLDKFIGDGILAYFGAPLARADHASAAVRCAVEMAAGVEALNVRRR